MSLDEKILSSDIDNSIQATTSATPSFPYHTSVCGSILYTAPTNTPSDIFSFLRHGNFDAFRRSIDIYHNDIIKMTNEHGQVNNLVDFTIRTLVCLFILTVFRRYFM